MALFEHEKATLGKILGQNISIQASGIAKLYLASPNPRRDRHDKASILNFIHGVNDKGWKFTGCVGMLVFIINRADDCTYFQLFDINSYQLLFEFELYYDMKYESLKDSPQFHSFEMKDCVCGFSFSDRHVAHTFLSKVKALSPSLNPNKPVNLIKQTRRKNQNQSYGRNPAALGQLPRGMSGAIDVTKLSPEWKALFKKAGVRKKDFRDPLMAEFIRAVIEEATGYSAAAPPVNVSEQKLQQYYSQAQMAQYRSYMTQMAEYEKQNALYQESIRKRQEWEAYEREQQALAQWEADNAALIAKANPRPKPRKRSILSFRTSFRPRKNTTDRVKMTAPPLPPRKVKSKPKKPSVVSTEEPVMPNIPALPKLPSEYYEEETSATPPISKASGLNPPENWYEDTPAAPTSWSGDGPAVLSTIIPSTSQHDHFSEEQPEIAAAATTPGFNFNLQEAINNAKLRAVPEELKKKRAPSEKLLKMIKKQAGNLEATVTNAHKRASRLPNIDDMSESAQHDLLTNLKIRLNNRRKEVETVFADSDESDGDWSD